MTRTCFSLIDNFISHQPIFKSEPIKLIILNCSGHLFFKIHDQKIDVLYTPKWFLKRLLASFFFRKKTLAVLNILHTPSTMWLNWWGQYLGSRDPSENLKKRRLRLKKRGSKRFWEAFKTIGLIYLTPYKFQLDI